ncbi:hypothetical protein NPA07_00070 [Mycoplasmopsis caviae]|uniref:Lipoprotein n=1 Tax=Mycoplasmopsis caviae TaxID=55603 RepID=A0A3P8K983_9BACT|nr:hypothetical protein [Mycoplasmopsis caviae]UUD35266.1 hypothetical protein NPA07_00070 [Mycoplasmopsis caviae]VDR41949.1 Uncharacterised protein [Mycoplasmopsis caviae]
MSKKLRKFNKLLMPTLVISGALPFVAAQCNKKSKNEPQTEAQKIESAKTKIKELLKILQTNKTKYVGKTYEKLSKNVEQIVSKINATLNKQNVTLDELTQFETKTKQEIAELENTFNKLKSERDGLITKFHESRNLLISFFKLLTEKPVEDNLDWSVEKSAVESIINDTDKLIKDLNTLNRQISEKNTLLEQQILQINNKLRTSYNLIKTIVEDKLKQLTDSSYTTIKNQITEILKNAENNNMLVSFYENTYYLLSVKFKELLEIKKNQFKQLKTELGTLILQAVTLKEMVNNKFANISTTNLETAISNATVELNNNEASKESIETVKNNLLKEISIVKVAIAKEELGNEIKNVESEYSKISDEKFYKSLKSSLKEVIEKAKAIQSQTNKSEAEYKQALTKLKSSFEATKTNEKKIAGFVQSITKSLNESQKSLSEKENKKLFENKVAELKNQLSNKKTEYENETFNNMPFDAVINKLEDYQDSIENLYLSIDSELKQIKDEYDEYLDEWEKINNSIKKFEERISNIANKDELMQMYNNSNEYNQFKNEANIRGYNISSKEELQRISTKVNNDFYNAKKKFTKEEISRLLIEFETEGKKHNDEDYMKIIFKVQSRNNMNYSELKELMKNFDEDLYILEALLKEVEQKLREYKEKLNKTI